MIKPTIHMNGTSREELNMQLCAAVSALTDAIAAMQRAAPHGRDYYPQGPDVINSAIAEHRVRLGRVEQVRDELTEIAIAPMEF